MGTRRRIGLVLGLTVLWVLAGVDNGQATDGWATYRASGSPLSFRYPRTWTIQTEDPSGDTTKLPVYLINGQPAPRDVMDGELRIDIDSPEPANGRSVEDLLTADCKSSDPANFTVRSCQVVEINGHRWSWVVEHEPVGPPPGIDRFLATTFNGQVFRVGGFVPDGPHQLATLAEMKDVLVTLSLGSALPKTGAAPAPWLFPCGLSVTLLGWLLRQKGPGGQMTLTNNGMGGRRLTYKRE